MRLPVLAMLLACAACATAPSAPTLLQHDVRTMFPPSVRDRVGVTPERLARYGKASPALVEVVARELGTLEGALAGCSAKPGVVYATFLVAPDGRAVEPIAATEKSEAEVEACAARALERWSVSTADEHGGFVWAVLAVGGPSPSSKGAAVGWTAVRERERGCTGRSIAKALRYQAAGTVLLKFAVHGDGTIGEVHTTTPVPPEILAAMERGLADCAFEPGRNPAGEPVPMWVILPLRFK